MGFLKAANPLILPANPRYFLDLVGAKLNKVQTGSGLPEQNPLTPPNIGSPTVRPGGVKEPHKSEPSVIPEAGYTEPSALDPQTLNPVPFPVHPQVSKVGPAVSRPTTGEVGPPTLVICAAVGFVLVFLGLVLFSWRVSRRRWRAAHRRPKPSISAPVRGTSTESCTTGKRLGFGVDSLRRVVSNSFRVVRRQASKPRKTSSQSQGKEGLGTDAGESGIRAGLTEVELSQILSSPPRDPPPLGAERSASPPTLPTDSWDQYMSILKHEEHLHFEDITPAPSAKHPGAETSYHRSHPSLLSHYFYATIGGLNRVEPYNGSPTKPSAGTRAAKDCGMASYTPPGPVFQSGRGSKKGFPFQPRRPFLSRRITLAPVVNHAVTEGSPGAPARLSAALPYRPQTGAHANSLTAISTYFATPAPAEVGPFGWASSPVLLEPSKL
ncbi:hypothetical protein L0F63_004489 [Massospora cicadina]|nr:hypothetical protein L0F63_004489 [Massospora cicadina]